jgi:hypothetical protein
VRRKLFSSQLKIKAFMIDKLNFLHFLKFILGSRFHSLPFDQVGSKYLRTFAGKATSTSRYMFMLRGVTSSSDTSSKMPLNHFIESPITSSKITSSKAKRWSKIFFFVKIPVNDHEIEFQEIEIGIFQEIETFCKIDLEIEKALLWAFFCY